MESCRNTAQVTPVGLLKMNSDRWRREDDCRQAFPREEAQKKTRRRHHRSYFPVRRNIFLFFRPDEQINPIAYVCSGRSVTCDLKMDIGSQTFGQNGQFAVIPDFSEYSGQQFLEADGSGVLVGHRRVALRLNVAGPGYLRMSHKEEQKLWSVTFMSSLSS